MSCDSDDSNDDNIEPAPTPNPPTEGEAFFVTKAYDPIGLNPSLAWSTDLEEWTIWHNGFSFNSVDNDGDELIYSKINDIEYNIYISDDGGRTESVFSPPSGLTFYSSAVHREGTLILEYSNTIYTTTDNGLNWQNTSLVENFTGNIFYLNDEFVFFVSSGNIYTSQDGSSWNVSNIGFTFDQVLNYDGGYYLGSINSNSLYKTAQDYETILDTILVERIDTTQDNTLSQARFLLNGNNLEAFGTFYDDDIQMEVPYKCTSLDDGQTWTFERTNTPVSRSSGSSINWPYDSDWSFTYQNGFYYANFYSDLIARTVPHYSTDGIDWQRVNDPVLKFEYEGFYFVSPN